MKGCFSIFERRISLSRLTAITEWNAGNLDALVASKEKAAVLMRDLKGAALSQLQSNEREQHDQGRGYVLITR